MQRMHAFISYLLTMKMNTKQDKLLKRLQNPLLFRFFTRKMVPAASHAGVKLVELTPSKCVTRVPFKPRNKNPFRSMYFAVQSMAAEMSTALLGMFHMEAYDVSIAWIVVDFKAEFPKKATGDVTFTCEDGESVAKAIEAAANTDEAHIAELTTTGRLADGTVVSVFVFQWSFKKRKS